MALDCFNTIFYFDYHRLEGESGPGSVTYPSICFSTSINSGSGAVLLLRFLNFKVQLGNGYNTEPVSSIKSGSGTALLLIFRFLFRPIRTLRPIVLLNFPLNSINTGSDTLLLLGFLNLTKLVYCIKSGSGTELMLTTHFHFRPVRTVQPILIFFWAGSGLLKINTNSGTGMLTYFRRGSGHENEYGSDTVGSGISPNAFLVSEQRSMPEYGYGFSYNLPLNGSAIFRRRSSYEIGHGTGTFGSGIKFNHVLVPVHSSEYGYGCGTRTLLTPSIFRIGTGTFGSGTNFNHVSVPVNRSEYGYRCGISFNYVSVPVHISEYGYGLFLTVFYSAFICVSVYLGFPDRQGVHGTLHF